MIEVSTPKPIVISIIKIIGGVKSIPKIDASKNIGIAFKLYNNQSSDEFLKAWLESTKRSNTFGFPINIADVSEFHKPGSRYKYLTVVL